MDRMMTRHPLSALWGDLAPSDLASMRESIQEYGFTDPVIWTYDGAVLDGWHRYTIANLLGLELEVREYDGDPVQWVIGRNLHRRHLTALQKGSCTSAALEWAQRGQQKRLDRDQNTGQFTISANTADMVNQNESPTQEFFTAAERSALAEVSVRTQVQADRYERAGLGPEIRSGAISGAEAERRVRDPDTPRPPSRLQQLDLRLEAQDILLQEKDDEIQTWKGKYTFAVSQSSEYPHEKEAAMNMVQVDNSALRSSVNVWMTKCRDAEARARWFEKQARSHGWEPTVG